LLLLALSASTAFAKSAEPPKRGSDCARCDTIARDYGKAWDTLSTLLQEETDLKNQIAEINRTFQAAYFGDDPAELDKWSRDSAAAERRVAELPAEIERVRKELEARHADLLDCLRRNCFSAAERRSAPSDAGAEEACKACADNANRVADLTAQLVRLNEVAAQLDSQIPTRETALKEAEAAHDRDTLNPPLVVVQKSREVLGFLENQRDTLQDAIKALGIDLDKAQKALEDCRAKNCAATTAVTPPPRPPPPSCAKCEGLEKQIAADRDEVARLKSVRETFEQTKTSLDKQEKDNRLQASDKTFIDAAAKRLAEIDADLKRLDNEITDLNTKLERCKNEPCAEPPASATSEKKAGGTAQPEMPLKKALDKALKKLGPPSSKKVKR
jgi:chromosome segregation ATPase